MANPAMPARVQLINQLLLDRVRARAEASLRGRVNHNFHSGPDDNPHRFLNALTRGSYCAPHRHAAPPKAESFLVLSGEVLVVIFGDQGEILERHVLGRAGLRGIDIPPGVWHTITAVSLAAVCYEVKPGPWDPENDKEFAPWAPREGDPLALATLVGWLGDL
ncbi:MAG TPA: WbuC family cupin fold metalloprotein [Polyangiaceae bacterium]